MDRRLRNYIFKSFVASKKRVVDWFRKYSMECVVWAVKNVRRVEDEDDISENSDEGEVN